MLLELVIVFLKLGLFTIGGGLAMVPVLQDVLIREKKWFTEEEFVDMIAICQSLPGVVAINMATYVGYKKKGLAGSLISTLAVILPSWSIIIIICKCMAVLGDNSYINGAMAGFRAAAVGLIITAVYQLGKIIFKNKWSAVAAVSAFIMVVFLNIGTAWIIVIFLALGVASATAAHKGLVKSAATGTDSNTQRGIRNEDTVDNADVSDDMREDIRKDAELDENSGGDEQ